MHYYTIMHTFKVLFNVLYNLNYIFFSEIDIFVLYAKYDSLLYFYSLGKDIYHFLLI